MSAAVSEFSLDQLLAGRRFALLVNRAALAATCAAVYVSASTKEVEDDTVPAYVRGAVATLWPLSLMGAELVLTRVPAVGSTAVLWTTRLGAFIVALCAFTGSAEHSISLAERVGASEATAYTAPVILDGLLIISGVVLVALAAAIMDLRRAEAAAVVSPLRFVAEPNTAAAASPVEVKRNGVKAARGKVSSDDVAKVLRDDPSATAASLAERFGVSAKTISRTDAWRNRNQTVSEPAV